MFSATFGTKFLYGINQFLIWPWTNRCTSWLWIVPGLQPTFTSDSDGASSLTATDARASAADVAARSDQVALLKVVEAKRHDV